MTNWTDVVFSSHYDAAVAIREALGRGDTLDAMAGIEELIQSMSRSEEHELYTRLALLMAHVVKWKTQPPGTKSWRLTINEQRRQLARLRQKAPRFTQERLERDLWEVCLAHALAMAEDEMDCPPAVTRLSWEDVFETRYDEREHEPQTKP
jgi:hypothetical protein